jgi:hypothetical protein
MKTPQGWTNYSGGTYFVRIPVAPARSEERENGAGSSQDNSSTNGSEPAQGTKDIAARARW